MFFYLTFQRPFHINFTTGGSFHTRLKYRFNNFNFYVFNITLSLSLVSLPLLPLSIYLFFHSRFFLFRFSCKRIILFISMFCFVLSTHSFHFDIVYKFYFMYFFKVYKVSRMQESHPKENPGRKPKREAGTEKFEILSTPSCGKKTKFS